MIDEETILTLSLEAAWKLFTMKKKEMMKTKNEDGDRIEPIITEEDYEKARFGIEIEFEIEDYLNDEFRSKPKYGTIVIKKEEYELRDFRTEIEERESIIRNALLQLYSEDTDIIKRK